MVHAFNKLLGSRRDTVVSVSSASAKLSTAAAEMARATEDASRRIDDQEQHTAQVAGLNGLAPHAGQRGRR